MNGRGNRHGVPAASLKPLRAMELLWALAQSAFLLALICSPWHSEEEKDNSMLFPDTKL